MLVDMVMCLDAFTGQRTRLVVIVDGLDSCEQTKVRKNLIFKIRFSASNYNTHTKCTPQTWIMGVEEKHADHWAFSADYRPFFVCFYPFLTIVAKFLCVTNIGVVYQ